MKLPQSLQNKLENRSVNNLLRTLPEANNLIDFASNDYLGFSRNETIFQKIKLFKPEFILLSSGFHAHIDDPLAQVNLQSKDFAELTDRLIKVAKEVCDNKIVSVLEGGYDLMALQESTSLHVQSLLKV